MAKETATGALRSLGRVARRFRRDDRGQIAIIFGLSITGMLVATGAGLDLTRAYQARQMLYQVATMSCQYASRPSVVQLGNATYVAPSGGPTYTSAVGNYIQAALASQTFPWTQSNATPFTYTANGPAAVSLAASVPTAFMQIVNVSQLPVAATSHCYDSPSSLTQRVPNSRSPYLIREGFEAGGNGGVAYIPPSGQSNANPSTTFAQTPNYTGADGTKWYGTGYCLETDQVGLINSTTPEGVRSAELDCDNGSGTAGNSATSTKLYLPVGNYELRYSYRGRVSYPNYDPVSICGSSASDVSWANDTNSVGGPVANALRTNQMNVYLDLNTTGSPPMHAVGSQQLAGANLIDVCVHSTKWVERSVRIYVNTPGFYWLSFAADGQNDSFGAQLDNIRLCPETCPGTVADSFPTEWLPSGGVSRVLFRDRFEAPTYGSNPCGGQCNWNGNLNLSLGTSGSSSGWSGQSTSGWATAPYNQVDYYLASAPDGSQYIELDGSSSGSQTTSNRLISRPFLLSPGYYRASYFYKGTVTLSGVSGVYCGATPAAAGLNIAIPAGYDTNIAGVFMSHAQMASTPVGGGTLNATTSYLNPNGTTTTTPTVPPNALSLSNHNPAQPNALLDVCGYATSWQSRTADIAITKPAYYWLTLSGLGQADNTGPAIDDVRLTALGSRSMASPPASPVTIPVADPQPGSRVTYTGFYIIADPLSVPAPLQ